MFLDSLTSTLPTSTTPSNLITSTSHHESSTCVSSSGRSETAVITSSTGSSIPDVISLDWKAWRIWSGGGGADCLFACRNPWTICSLDLLADIYWRGKNKPTPALDFVALYKWIDSATARGRKLFGRIVCRYSCVYIFFQFSPSTWEEKDQFFGTRQPFKFIMKKLTRRWFCLESVVESMCIFFLLHTAIM